MALSLVGTTFSASATGSFPAGIQDGDLVLAYAGNGTAATVPSLPGDYTDDGSRSGNLCAMRTAHKFYATGDASPTFTNAGGVLIEVYRGADTNDPIGAYNNNNASSATITFPALTPFDKTDGTSWFSAAVVGNRPDVVIPAPTNTTLRQQSGTRPGWLVVDSNGGVTTWAQHTVSVSRAAGYTVCQVEVKAKTTVTVTVQRDIPYKMNGMIAVQRDLPSKIRGFVQTQRDLLYTVTKTVGALRRLPSSIHGAVGIDRMLLWDILAPVSTTTVGIVTRLPYGVRTLVSAARGIPYKIRKFVGTARVMPYTVRNLVSNQRRLPYTVRVLVGALRREPYGIRTLVSAVRREPYSIRGFVQKAATLVWSNNVPTDSYTDTDNTDITAHTAEDGFGWIKHPNYTPDARVIGNTLHPVATNNASLHMASVIPASPDYDVVMNFASAYTVKDSFVGAATTPLESHVADTGESWNEHPQATAGNNQISDQNRLRCQIANGVHYLNETPPSAEYDVVADHFIKSITGNSVGIGQCVRMSSTVLTFYHVRLNSRVGVGQPRWELYKFVNGTGTLLGESVDYPISIGQSINVRLVCRDAYKAVEVDGTELIRSTDNAITAAGFAGVRASLATSNLSGIHLDNFSVVPTITDRSLPAVCGRIVPNADTYLFARLDTATAAHKIQLFKQVASAATSLGIFNTTFTPSTLPEVRLRMVGNQISVLVNNVVQIGPVTVNDAALQNAGRWGVRTGQVTNVFSGTGIHIDRVRFNGTPALPVVLARILPYKVRQLIGTQRRLPYSVRGLVGLVRNLGFASRALARASRTLSWVIETSVINELLIKARIKVKVEPAQVAVFPDLDRPEVKVDFAPAQVQVPHVEPKVVSVDSAEAPLVRVEPVDHPVVRVRTGAPVVRVGKPNPTVDVKENN